MNVSLLLSTFALFSLGTGIVGAQTSQPIPFDAAKKDFEEANALCTADAGKLWGVSLCGPMMFIDPDTRFIVASQPDADGVLIPQSGVYTGVFPKTENISSTAIKWSGTHWTQMIWPLPDPSLLNTSIMHELYHRIQDQLKIPMGHEGDNAHLDTLHGRYLLQLEYRALTKALNADTDVDRHAAIADALLFRAERYRLFPQGAAQETALELNEGLAEYTGVKLGNPQPTSATKAALNDIANQTQNPTFVRSFAYATGPAYGLLLDRYRPNWRVDITSGQDLYELLQSALKIHLPVDLQHSVELRASRYDGRALYVAEKDREAKRQTRLALYRTQFIDGAILTLPLKDMNVQFNPRTLQPLGNSGTVYPTLRITDLWGILEVSKGALLNQGWSTVVVVAPAESSGSVIKGEGWTLDLKPGWKLVPAARKGDFLLEPAS